MAMNVEQMTVGTMGVCCYLVACDETGEGCVIDPGGDEPEILAAIEKHKIRVKYIVNTHGHPDHVCGNGPIKAATGAAIVMHEADALFFERPEVRGYFAQLGLPASPPVDLRVKDNDRLAFGKQTLLVIHTPGHTPGGICLYNAPHLFTGDTLFAGAVGRSDFPGGDSHQLLDAIKSRLLALPPETIVWPGHGYGGDRSTLAAEARENPFLTGRW